MKKINKILLAAIAAVFIFACFTIVDTTDAKADDSWVVYTEYNGVQDWWYTTNGVVNTAYTGIAQNENGWWRIVNGRVDFNATGVYQNEYGWWYCWGGKVQFDYTGIQPNENGWWRIVGGKVDFDATGVYQNEYGWWYCWGGKVQFDYNGVITYNGVTYNVSNGYAYVSPKIAICSTYGSGYQADSSLIYALRNIGCTVEKISSYDDISGYAGLVIAGGIDINPAFYGEYDYACESYSTSYDNEQFAIIKKFVDAGKPILGVCRGCEILNVYFGGSLNQNISGHRASSGGYVWHYVSAQSGSLIASLCGSRFGVISQHHQSIKALGNGLTATLWADDGTIECIAHTSLPIIGVMWHPEYMNNDTSYALLNYFAYTMCS